MAAQRSRWFIPFFLVTWFLAVPWQVQPAAAADDGSVPLLVRTTVPLTQDVIDAIGVRTLHVSYVWPEIQTMAVTINPRLLADLNGSPLVAAVENDVEVQFEVNDAEIHSTLVPDMLSSIPIQTWNQDMVDTPGSGYGGVGVTVAVVDAGLPQNWEEFLPAGSVDLEHAAGFGAEGWGDFHNPVNAIHGAGGHIGLFPHGLAVSSVVVGFPSAFGPIGGSAPAAKVLPVRVLNQFNYGWISWFTAGILHVANLKASGAISGPLVINFSIQIQGYSPTLATAIDYAISKGVLFVTIAGNYNPSYPVSFPGSLPQSITAAAAGWRQEGSAPAPWFFADVPENDASQVYVAPFSGREPGFVAPTSQIDVLAPGSFVFGEWLVGPGFSEGREVTFNAVDNFIFGTSFAAPHVAGVVAQMLEKNPTLTQSQAEAILRATALPVPPSAVPFVTPLGFYVLPWDNWATGTGLARGTMAVAATPAAPALATAAKSEAVFDGDPVVELSRYARVVSHVGSAPVVVEWRALAEGSYSAKIFDAQGRMVRSWRSDAIRSGKALWDGRDQGGSPVRQGIYFVRLESARSADRVKVVVLRR